MDGEELRLLGTCDVTMDGRDLSLLLAAGKFATAPETMPVFEAWARENMPAGLVCPAGEIRARIRAISASLAGPWEIS